MIITKEQPFLAFPVSYTAASKHLVFREGGKPIYELDIPLDALHPAYEVYIPMEHFAGRELTLETEPAMPVPVRSAAADEAARHHPLRPFFHFTAKQGWINDPNGLCTAGGVYHLFYQYNPASHVWGNMHWGHATSPDLLHWTEREPALYPDELGTMFSGSAVVDTDNRSGLGDGMTPPLLLFYTAFGKEASVQCLAFSIDDGATFQKYDRNPLIPSVMPGNRDPKVIYHQPSGRYVMALYLDGHKYSLFGSNNLLDWQLQQVITLEEDWECPDFYPLPLDGAADKTKWVLCGAFDRYLVGEFDGWAFRALQPIRRLHWGNASYAAQSWFNLRPGDDRRVRIAWNNHPLPPAPFQGCMTFPCEMTLRTLDGAMCLCANPIDEIASLYDTVHEQTTPSLPFAAPLAEGGYDIRMTLNGGAEAEAELTVCGLHLCLDWKTGLLTCGENQAPLCAEKGRVSLRLLLDMPGAEIFLGQGQALLTWGQPLDYNLARLTVAGADVALRHISIAALQPVCR